VLGFASVKCGDVKYAKTRSATTPWREDNMTTSRISAAVVALSIAFGSVGGAGSAQGSAKDQKQCGTIASSKRMADGKE